MRAYCWKNTILDVLQKGFTFMASVLAFGQGAFAESDLIMIVCLRMI
jgi:hypothetical protein